MYVNMYVCIFLCACVVCVCACMHARWCVRVLCVCVRVCTHVDVCVCVYQDWYIIKHTWMRWCSKSTFSRSWLTFSSRNLPTCTLWEPSRTHYPFWPKSKRSIISELKRVTIDCQTKKTWTRPGAAQWHAQLKDVDPRSHTFSCDSVWQ